MPIYFPTLKPLSSQLPPLQRRELPQEMTRTFITPSVLVQILLMIILGVPPSARGQYLRNDLSLPPLLIHQFCNLPRDALLLRRMVKDARSVLRAGIRTLSVRRGGVVHLVKIFEEAAVGDLFRIERNLQCFGIYKNVSISSSCNQIKQKGEGGENIRPVLPEQTAR